MTLKYFNIIDLSVESSFKLHILRTYFK